MNLVFPTFIKRLKKSAVVSSCFFLLSCSVPVDTPVINENYKLGLVIDNMGDIHNGIAVLKDKPLYTIDIEASGSIDYLSFNSCSTTITRTNAGGTFNDKKTRINFRPNLIEKELACDIRIDITNKKARHTFGYIIFQSKLFDLDAKVICGKETKIQKGVSTCQLLTGNYFRISFDQKVLAHSEDCEIEKSAQVFDLKAESGFCNYYFISGEQKHRLLVHGWTKELLN